MPAIKVSCTCNHAFQDNAYGKGVRIANEAKAPDGRTRHRCTVCSKIHDGQATKKV